MDSCCTEIAWMGPLPPVQSGAVLGRRFQPYESHVPYLLQVKVDFNLYGMGFLRLAKALFRCGLCCLV